MACKDITVVIDDRACYARQWDAQTALENLAEATQVFGASLAGYIEGKYMLGDIMYALQHNDSKRTVELLRKFCCACRIEGKLITSDSFKTEYMGDLYFVFKVFAMVCELNYKDFFTEGERLYSLSQNESEAPAM